MRLWRQWFRIDRAWVERRDALLRAEEDALFAKARDAATGEERAFVERPHRRSEPGTRSRL
jgi:hypothetical protein